MYYIQTINHNAKKYNFSCTEQEYNSIDENDIYEYKVKDHYLEIKKDGFEEIDESKCKELKLYVTLVDFSKLKKRKEKVEFVYCHEVELMHGDADFYLDELFCISKEDYEFIRDTYSTVDFETYDKSDPYDNLMITTSLTHDDFTEIDSRLCGITHDLQEKSKYRNFELRLQEDLMKDIIDGEDEDGKGRYDIWIDNYIKLVRKHQSEIPKYKGLYIVSDDFFSDLILSEKEVDSQYGIIDNFNEEELAELSKLEKEYIDDLYVKHWREINPFAIIVNYNGEDIAIPICKFTKKAIDTLRKANYFGDKEYQIMLYDSIKNSETVTERIATRKEIDDFRKLLIDNVNNFKKKGFEYLKEYIEEISDSLSMNYYD